MSIVIFSGLFMQTLFSEFHSHCVPHTFGLVTTKLNLLNNYFLLIVTGTPPFISCKINYKKAQGRKFFLGGRVRSCIKLYFLRGPC